ncbi:MAG: PAS domain-containing protein, partial [Pseudonocardiaceae bacterium]
MSAPVSREEVARSWSDALSTTAYVPASNDEIDHFLLGLLDRLIDALTQPTFSPQPGADVGARLVARGYIGERSLGTTVEILGHALPTQHELQAVEGLTGKVVSLLGTLATGYTTAFRRQALDQQEDVKRALLRATREAEQGLRVSEARFREVFDAAPLGIAISRLDGAITYANAALAEIL